jgi:hypothetical protein
MGALRFVFYASDRWSAAGATESPGPVAMLRQRIDPGDEKGAGPRALAGNGAHAGLDGKGDGQPGTKMSFYSSSMEGTSGAADPGTFREEPGEAALGSSP